jgi:hypothetical protein
MSWRFTLEEPPAGTERLRCGHCEKVGELARHKLVAIPENEPGATRQIQGDVFVCPACHEGSRRANRTARGLALGLFVPSTLALFYGVARGVQTVVDMVSGLRPVSLSQILLAVALIPFGAFLSYRALRLVTRALSAGWLLPLKDITGKKEKK